jgi:hypothetical protein
MMTPKMTNHGRERCVEMGISTKVPKRIVRDPSITHVAKDGRMIATSDVHPEYAVVYAVDEDGTHWIVTVLFNTQVRYKREGATWTEDP